MKLGINVKGINKKIEKISRVYKLIFFLFINCIIFGLVFYFLIMPQVETKKKLNDDYQNLRKELNKMVAIKNNMDKYRQEYAALQAVLTQVLKQLPESKDIPNILRSVSNVAAETRIKFEKFEPKKVQNKEFYAELPLEIKYSGSYHNLGYFFDGVRRLERIIHVTDFSLDAKGPPTKVVLDGTCTALTYMYLKEAPKKQETKKETKGAQAPPKK
jgi:type IV pilus assembly protein PilO